MFFLFVFSQQPMVSQKTVNNVNNVNLNGYVTDNEYLYFQKNRNLYLQYLHCHFLTKKPDVNTVNRL